MKRTQSKDLLRNGGIMRFSTMCLLTGSGFTLNSCNSDKTYTASPEDVKMAALEQQLDEVDKRRTQLMSGEIENNFELPGLGFYHSEAKDFFPHKHGFSQDGKWFANGEWIDHEPNAPSPSTSRPSPIALQKIQQLLEREKALASQTGGSSTSYNGNHHTGPSTTSLLMMYWLLSGNRGGFTPGPGFQYGQQQQNGWQQNMNRDRQTVSSYANTNPGYAKLREQSKATGKPVTSDSSVRGGFGSKSSGFSSSGT